MNDRDLALANRINGILSAAQAEYRASLRGLSTLTPPIPETILAKVSKGMAPLLRSLVDAAVAEKTEVTR